MSSGDDDYGNPQREIDTLRAELTRLRTRVDDMESDAIRIESRLKNALDQLLCPDCGCADEVDAQSQECGCDSPICSIGDGKTLAESFLDMCREQTAADVRECELQEEITRLRTANAALRAECMVWRTAADNYTGDVRVVLSQWPHIEAIASARQLTDSTPGAMEGANG